MITSNNIRMPVLLMHNKHQYVRIYPNMQSTQILLSWDVNIIALHQQSNLD